MRTSSTAKPESADPKTPKASPTPCNHRCPSLQSASRQVSGVGHKRISVLHSTRIIDTPCGPERGYCKASSSSSHEGIYTQPVRNKDSNPAPYVAPSPRRSFQIHVISDHIDVSTPSSILAGIPPAYPCDAVASIRAIFALCESVLRLWGDLC